MIDIKIPANTSEDMTSKKGQGVKVFDKHGKLIENVTSILVMDGKVFAVWAMEDTPDGGTRKTWRFGSSVNVEITNFTKAHKLSERAAMAKKLKRLLGD